MKYNLPKNLKSKIKYNFNLSKSNWFQTGGKADVYCNVINSDELKIILAHIQNNIPIFIIGVGSNTLIRDGGFRGIVIKLGKGFNNICFEKNKLTSGAAVLDSTLSKFALRNSISNLEFFSGIPGSLGGAIKMNAGCFGSETKDVLFSATVMKNDGKIIIIQNAELELSA